MTRSPSSSTTDGRGLPAVERLKRELLRQRLQLNSDEIAALLERLRIQAARVAAVNTNTVSIDTEFSGREFDFVIDFEPGKEP